MNDREYRFRVEPPGGRLDRVLAQQAPDLSRSRWQKVIDEGLVVVDDQVVTKAAHPLAGGELIQAVVPPPKPSELTPEPIPLDILYEDDRLLVINKPAGMVVHPAPGHSEGTLVHAALAHDPDIRGVGGKKRPGVVHRLDMDTSGVLLMAKDDGAHQSLQRQFKGREVGKRYLALVDGSPPTPSGRVEAPIGRHSSHRKKMAVVVGERGRRAVSVYHTEERFAAHTLLRVEPETGRTHQIRVHLAFLECPVVGDRVYGRRNPSLQVERQMLHAASITLVPPGASRKVTWSAPLPPDFSELLASLRRNRSRGV